MASNTLALIVFGGRVVCKTWHALLTLVLGEKGQVSHKLRLAPILYGARVVCKTRRASLSIALSDKG